MMLESVRKKESPESWHCTVLDAPKFTQRCGGKWRGNLRRQSQRVTVRRRVGPPLSLLACFIVWRMTAAMWARRGNNFRVMRLDGVQT
jgi:hypothetical protein